MEEISLFLTNNHWFLPAPRRERLQMAMKITKWIFNNRKNAENNGKERFCVANAEYL